MKRGTTVELFCGASGTNEFIDIVEDSTCHYNVKISLARLCEHPEFAPVKPTIKTLEFHPVLTEEELAEEGERLRRERQRREAIESAAADDDEIHDAFLWRQQQEQADAENQEQKAEEARQQAIQRAREEDKARRPVAVQGEVI